MKQTLLLLALLATACDPCLIEQQFCLPPVGDGQDIEEPCRLQIRTVDWSPEGHTILFNREEEGIHFLQIETGRCGAQINEILLQMVGGNPTAIGAVKVFDSNTGERTVGGFDADGRFTAEMDLGLAPRETVTLSVTIDTLEEDSDVFRPCLSQVAWTDPLSGENHLQRVNHNVCGERFRITNNVMQADLYPGDGVPISPLGRINILDFDLTVAEDARLTYSQVTVRGDQLVHQLTLVDWRLGESWDPAALVEHGSATVHSEILITEGGHAMGVEVTEWVPQQELEGNFQLCLTHMEATGVDSGTRYWLEQERCREITVEQP